MNFKIQILAACASLLLASSAVALPTPARVPKAHKNVPAIVPAAPHDVLANVGADVTPIATVDASFGPVNPLQAALDFAQERLTTTGSPFTEYIVKDSYTTKHNGMTHVYLRQVVNGLEVINGDMNINVMADGSILSSGNSFFAGQYAPEIADNFMPTMSPADALAAFSRHIGEELPSGFFGSGVEEDKIDDKSAILRNVPYALSDVPARLVYVQDGNALKLGWELTVEMDNNWFYTVVDAREASVLAVNDWVSQALPTYNVLPFGVEDPTFGNRQLVDRTSNSKASPLGWHDDGSKKYTTTEGNNVDARSRSAILLGTNRRPDGGANLLFDLPADFSKGSPKDYHLAAVAQLFHTVNRYHDLTYLLGFDEVSGNFQTNNFGKGGKGSDAVIANAQDPSGTNNANFATPVDGSAGKMNMFIFTQTTPNRDGDFQQGIVIHEYTHGVSTRLTGGPANSNCLPSGESGGMGEGWGDAFGAALSILPTDTRNTKITMGAWVMGNNLGVRKYAYSSDMTVDPETYGYLKKSGYSEVHAIGEVWAGILNEVYWNLHEAKGWQQDIFDIDVSTAEARSKAKGNVIYMLNLIDGMKAQPCKPSFVDARNAILAADKANFGGANVCLMWKGFAKRGLGVNAKAGGVEDFTVPAECN